MTERVILQPAFILHRHPYRNTSWIVELLTHQYGRVGAVARSARGLKSRYQGKLELFMPMLVNWTGKSDLKSLGKVDLYAAGYLLSGKRLLCGFYINELLMKLLHRHDPHPLLYDAYQKTLLQLSDKAVEVQVCLRLFEKHLLELIGYGLNLSSDTQTQEAICAEAFYQYLPQRGFMRVAVSVASGDIFSGMTLIALQQENLDNANVLRESKRLMRQVVAQVLGEGVVLRSGELFSG